MGLTVVYCPDCGEGFYQRNGVAASVAWAEHYAEKHTEQPTEPTVGELLDAVIAAGGKLRVGPYMVTYHGEFPYSEPPTPTEKDPS